MPDDLNFAGEALPLKNPDILERMDRELLVNTYWQSNGLLMFKRAKKYFPIIEPILEKYNIPDDFKYLAVIESGLTNAVSPAGARGVWQIMPATGRENGLEVNDNVDERYHLEKSTEVACKYLIKSKEDLGSWTLAAVRTQRCVSVAYRFAWRAPPPGLPRQAARRQRSAGETGPEPQTCGAFA